MSYIKIEKLYKTFTSGKNSVEVLKGIDLKIDKGDIYGVVGFSGAGKSTLVRCLNRLEEPDSGTIIIGDTDMRALSKKELSVRRRKIGMIFQTFNLFDSKTVYQNVAFSLQGERRSKKEIEKRVDELLELVGLTDKKYAYPGQLSGGQKQRVGIARALANEPDVLLSDEATSALDPQTTLSVLGLLRDINKKLGLTIVLITHELEAVQYICNKVAILEEGVMIEKGTVEDVFLNPQSETGKGFLRVYKEFRKSEFYAGGAGI